MNATLGVLGGGQLGLMLAEAAEHLRVRTRVLDPSPDACAKQAAEHIHAFYMDDDALTKLAEDAAAVTVEFENVPAEAMAKLESRGVLVRPGRISLETGQDRLRERELFAQLGVPTPLWHAVDDEAGLVRALGSFPRPAILKSRRLGYDGKGQTHLEPGGDIEAIAAEAWEAVAHRPSILDERVTFVRELSVIAVRAADGTFRAWPLAENVHSGGILRVSRAPAHDVAPALQQQAEDVARAIMDRLGHVGVLAVEFFQLGNGADAFLAANEIAPRVHNTGHWTIEGARTSQFENHVRAVLSMALGPTGAEGFAGMVNVIGARPDLDALARLPGVHVHDYGKAERPGRKLGHVTVVASTEAEREQTLDVVESACAAAWC